MKKQPKQRFQRILVPLFTFFWWNRLWHEHNYCSGQWIRGHVVEVKGWRTAIVDHFGQGRLTVTFILGNFSRYD